MDWRALSQEIIRLKREKNAVLLVHNYQQEEIQLLADFLGDSLDLSRKASQVPESTIVFCGVLFMAETAKILSPDKKVLIPRLDASCPMAESMDVAGLKALKSQHPDAMVVTYVNSTAEVKAESDVCCTSANAIKVVEKVEAGEIIFAPDRNLAHWVQRFTKKRIIPWDGFCYVHQRFSPDEVRKARDTHPEALLIAHPECIPEIIDMADQVLSTSGMVRFARESDTHTLLVATEEGLIRRLQRENPGKKFFSAGTAKTCRGMKTIHLEDVHQSLALGQYEVVVPARVAGRARKAVERMLEYV